MSDILLIAVPRRSPNIQYATVLPEALGRLKACVVDAGFTAKCIDFNIDYFRNVFIRRDIFDEMEEHFQNVVEYGHRGTSKHLSKNAKDFWDGLLKRWVNIIKNDPSPTVGISIFSDQSLMAAYDLCEMIRTECPTKNIVIGGLVLSTNADKTTMYADTFIHDGLADHFITGEGERSLVEFLKGNLSYPGIDDYNFIQLEDLNTVPFSDYSDFDLSKYILPNPANPSTHLNPMISMSGSRGCIRQCMFCDVGHFWPTYRWVDPSRLANEMFQMYEKYGITNFHFSDSIMNASPPKFRIFLTKIYNYQQSNNIKFHLVGQMIIREPNRYGEDMFLLMKQAGFGVCMYGVESGSPQVRESMNKAYSQDALYYTIDMCIKYDMQVQCMVIVGYPTETLDDFEQTCNLIRRYANNKKNVIFSISTFTMDEESKECRLQKEHGKHHIYFDEIRGWVSPILDRYEALKRTLVAYSLLETLGYPIYTEWKTEIENDLERIQNLLNM